MAPNSHVDRSRCRFSLMKKTFLFLCIAASIIFTTAIVYKDTVTETYNRAREFLLQQTASLVLDDNLKLICHTFTGRLGNEMFQYASILAIAHATNRTAVFIASEQLDSSLEVPTTHPTLQLLLEARCGQVEVKRFETSCCTFNPDLFTLEEEDADCQVDLYLQSWKYFQDYDAEIRQALRFKDSLRQQASEVVAELRQTYRGSTLIGIHVRRGDLLDEHNLHIGYPNVSQEFLNRSVEYLHRIYPDSVFVVASDNIYYCKAHFPSGYEAVFLDGYLPAVDLTILASLDHIAISFGSFSWWAGYLNAGKVVYMKDLITGVPNTTIGKGFGSDNATDYICPDWIPI